MKSMLVLAAILVGGASAHAYQYEYKENVRYRSGASMYKCWTIKAWDVTASQLREYGSQVDSKLSSACREATNKKCKSMNSSISCKTSDNCSKTFRSCMK